MKMEKINDHQVRFMISSQDLSDHNLTLMDLKYGDHRTSALFKEMLQKAVDEYGFNKEELPIMVEAIPLAKDELLIIVSVVEDADELDPHFSRFAKNTETDPQVEETQSTFFETENTETIPKACVLSFDGIDDVIRFCKDVSWYPGKSSLYKEESGSFLLVLHRPKESSPSEFMQLLNELSEYGELMPNSLVIYAYLAEHETPVMDDAILKLKNM